MGETGGRGSRAFSVVRHDGVLAAAQLAVGPDGWRLTVRPVADDGRPIGPAEVVCGPPDDPGLEALRLLADRTGNP